MSYLGTESEAVLRQLQLRLSALEIVQVGVAQDVALGNPIAPPNVIPVVNQVRNGEFSHSDKSWAGPWTGDDDQNKQCFGWYSNDAPVAGQTITLAAGKALKEATHSTFNAAYGYWRRSAGQAYLVGVKSLDTPLPQPTAEPGLTLYVILRIAREVAATLAAGTRIQAGLWDTTAGRENWLKGGDLAVTAAVIGSPATTTSRKYKILFKMDKADDILSAETTVAAAPGDGTWSPGVREVVLSWPLLPGLLAAHIYRYDVVANVYRLRRIQAGGSPQFADNNQTFPESAVVAGYPTTGAQPFALGYSSQFALVDGNGNQQLPEDGGFWGTIEIPINVPRDYDKTLTTAQQVLRLALTTAPTSGKILVDKIGLGYQRGVTFAPHSEDLNNTHGVPPAGGGYQGGIGPGGGTGGGLGDIRCIAADTPVCQQIGLETRYVPLRELQPGKDWLDSGVAAAPNLVEALAYGAKDLFRVAVADGELVCTLDHPLLTRLTRAGAPDPASAVKLAQLQPGDGVVVRTEDGALCQILPIVSLTPLGAGFAGIPRLQGNHIFFAGVGRHKFAQHNQKDLMT